MHWFLSLFCLICIAFLNTYANDTLIVSYSQDKRTTEEEYLKLKLYLLENNTTRELQNQYALEVKMQRFSEYYAVVLPHIQTEDVRNRLLIILKPLFTHIFYIHEVESKRYQKEKTVHKLSQISHQTYSESDNWIDEIGLQWLAIWLLAVIGLILSVRNRYKIGQIDKTQKNLKTNQAKIEKDIQSLGEQ
jgi:hypothetical protein